MNPVSYQHSNIQDVVIILCNKKHVYLNIRNPEALQDDVTEYENTTGDV
jgi:hypothetical protein